MCGPDEIEVGEFAHLPTPKLLGPGLFAKLAVWSMGRQEIYRVLGPRDIGMEIHYIKLEKDTNGWLLESFMGPNGFLDRSMID